MCSVAVFAPSRPSLRVPCEDMRAFPDGRRKSLHEWYKKLTVNLAMGGSHSVDVPDTEGNMTDSRQSLISWFNSHANLSSDENHSDSDENTQAASFAQFLNAFNGQEKNSKLHERLVARNDHLGKRLYVVSEAKQIERTKWNTC